MRKRLLGLGVVALSGLLLNTANAEEKKLFPRLNLGGKPATAKKPTSAPPATVPVEMTINDKDGQPVTYHIIQEWKQKDGSIVLKVRDPKTKEEMLICDKEITHPEALASITSSVPTKTDGVVRPTPSPTTTIKPTTPTSSGTVIDAPGTSSVGSASVGMGDSAKVAEQLLPANFSITILPGQPLPLQAKERAAQLEECKEIYHTAIAPSQRELALETMVELSSGKLPPEVVELLCEAATSDPAPSVRAFAVRALVQAKLTSGPVASTLEKARNDESACVRDALKK